MGVIGSRNSNGFVEVKTTWFEDFLIQTTARVSRKVSWRIIDWVESRKLKKLRRG